MTDRGEGDVRCVTLTAPLRQRPRCPSIFICPMMCMACNVSFQRRSTRRPLGDWRDRQRCTADGHARPRSAPVEATVQGTIGIFVCEAVFRHASTKRSLNITANCVFASNHSRGGRFQSAAA